MTGLPPPPLAYISISRPLIFFQQEKRVPPPSLYDINYNMWGFLYTRPCSFFLFTVSKGQRALTHNFIDTKMLAPVIDPRNQDSANEVRRLQSIYATFFLWQLHLQSKPLPFKFCISLPSNVRNNQCDSTQLGVGLFFGSHLAFFQFNLCLIFARNLTE